MENSLSPSLCVICARAGSVGVPGKNYKEIAGKPLVAWAIEKALRIELFTDVVVSTDCERVSEIALQYGAKVPFIRPAELASSSSGKFAVWKHAVEECEKQFDRSYRTFVDIDCTTPLLKLKTIKDFFSQYQKEQAIPEVDGMISVAQPYRNPYFNMVERNPGGYLCLSKKIEASVERRQDAAQVWDVVAGVYAFDAEFIRSKNYLFDGVLSGFEVPREESFDIDEPFDFRMVSWLLEQHSDEVLTL